MAKWAESNGKQTEFQDAVYQAYFSEGRDIADRPVLLDIVAACDLSKEEAQKILNSNAFSKAVDLDWERSEALGIMVAPTYLINETKLAGPQPYETLEKLMAVNNIPEKRQA